MNYITISDLFQYTMVIVAVITLVVTIFFKKK